jgi:hypothetical protein
VSGDPSSGDPSSDAASPPIVAPAGPPPLGEKTAAVVLALLQDFYRHELGAEEDVHRTLPFFATALGLIITALNYSATQLPSWNAVVEKCGRSGSAKIIWQIIPCAWPLLLAGVSFSIVAAFSTAVLWLLVSATRRRSYIRVGPESAIVALTHERHRHYVDAGLIGEGLDATVAADLRQRLLVPVSQAVEANRQVTAERYQHRARAVWCLLWSLFFALVGITSVIVYTKFFATEGIAVTSSNPTPHSVGRPAAAPAQPAARPTTAPAPAQPAAKPTGNLTFTVKKGVDLIPFLKR